MASDLTLTSEEWYRFQKYIQRKKIKEHRGVLEGLGPNLILWGGATFVFVIMFAFIDTAHAFIFPETQLKDPDGFLSTVDRYRA